MTNTQKICWRELIVTSSDGGYEWDTLELLLERAPANLDTATFRDGRISEWPQFFLHAPGEEPDFDTPRVPVDWTGFERAHREACGADEDEDE